MFNYSYNESGHNPKLTKYIAILAFILFVPLFISRGIGDFDFWWWMSANISILLLLAAVLDKGWWPAIKNDFNEQALQKCGLGLLSALGLYIVFYAGNSVSRLLFSFAGSGIENVYAFKNNIPPLRIALLMALLIGPGEELFWRGFLQRRFQMEKGPVKGFVIATLLYTAVHLGSGNVMLIIAAGVCGIFWGFLYLRTGSMILNIVSHTLWDVAIFLLFPMSG